MSERCDKCGNELSEETYICQECFPEIHARTLDKINQANEEFKHNRDKCNRELQEQLVSLLSDFYRELDYIRRLAIAEVEEANSGIKEESANYYDSPYCKCRWTWFPWKKR